MDESQNEEKSIASTKALTAQMLCLYLVAIKFAQQKEFDVQKNLDSLKDNIENFNKYNSRYLQNKI